MPQNILSVDSKILHDRAVVTELIRENHDKEAMLCVRDTHGTYYHLLLKFGSFGLYLGSIGEFCYLREGVSCNSDRDLGESRFVGVNPFTGALGFFTARLRLQITTSPITKIISLEIFTGSL
jgi:hypothetical protein